MPYTMGPGMNMMMIAALIQIVLLVWFVFTLSAIRQDLRELVNLNKYRQHQPMNVYHAPPTPPNYPAASGPHPALRPEEPIGRKED
ncbi:hypothetical protein GTO89_14115 [Heliobacterium gestii]|uniref:Uncharacterized protein n=1 Tax=Heliomicrobium gestii TaxID=2699 RepID=A0A845LHW6_HELGE|nr:hypothetical protein [Heliomicrobium gestii]MBM7867776.1 hypothetical protein [Heliomicrobium gestii]MZP44169.1 hypothetical protein [Heliomicrobium gestii]